MIVFLSESAAILAAILLISLIRLLTPVASTTDASTTDTVTSETTPPTSTTPKKPLTVVEKECLACRDKANEYLGKFNSLSMDGANKMEYFCNMERQEIEENCEHDVFADCEERIQMFISAAANALYYVCLPSISRIYINDYKCLLNYTQPNAESWNAPCVNKSTGNSTNILSCKSVAEDAKCIYDRISINCGQVVANIMGTYYVKFMRAFTEDYECIINNNITEGKNYDGTPIDEHAPDYPDDPLCSGTWITRHLGLAILCISISVLMLQTTLHYEEMGHA